MIRLFKTELGAVAESDGRLRRVVAESWDELFNDPGLGGRVTGAFANGSADAAAGADGPAGVLAPIGSQEVWAAGVTYFRSRDARMEESKQAGGGDFYSKVYEAERPELFFKATPHRVAGPGAPVRIRRDSQWNVPEPELALAVNRSGAILGYTIGNDMSSRDIEGANPLYLPQAKVYDGCCALGPGILLAQRPLAPSTSIAIKVMRGGAAVFDDGTTLERMKRRPEELVQWLFRDNSFPAGCFLLTGTGVVPPNEFTLQSGDEVRISIEGLGELVNPVA